MNVSRNVLTPFSYNTTMAACGLLSHFPNNLRSLSLNNGFSKALSTTHITISRKDSALTPPIWRKTASSRKNSSKEESRLKKDSIVFKGETLDISQAKQLISDSCKTDKWKNALRVMEMLIASKITVDSGFTNLLVDDLCRRGCIGHAMQLVNKLEKLSFPTDADTYGYIVKSLCKHWSLDQCLQYTNRQVQKGFVPKTFAHNNPSLLRLACKERGADKAMNLFDHDDAKDLSTCYNVLLSGFCSEGRLHDAIRLFRDLQDPNVTSYNILLSALWNDAKWEESNFLLDEMNGDGKFPSDVTYIALIRSLAVHGKTDLAIRMLDRIEEEKKTASMYNPVIARLSLEGDVDTVSSVIYRMRYENVEPDKWTYSAISLLFSCDDEDAYSIFYTMASESSSISSISTFFNRVISSLCRTGDTYAAFKLLYELAKKKTDFAPDPPTYSTMMKGLCSEGMVEAAMKVLPVLEEYGGYVPNKDNYNALIRGLCKARRASLALEVFETMIGKGYVPNAATYTIIVGGIVYEGEMELAASVLGDLYRCGLVKRDTAERLVLQYGLKRVSL